MENGNKIKGLASAKLTDEKKKEIISKAVVNSCKVRRENMLNNPNNIRLINAYYSKRYIGMEDLVSYCNRHNITSSTGLPMNYVRLQSMLGKLRKHNLIT